MAFDQSSRYAAVSTELGDDVVVLERLQAEERLSEPFTFHVDVLTAGAPTDFSPLLGSTVGVTMQTAEAPGTQRAFNGKLFEAAYVGESDAGIHYRLTLRPWLSLLAGNLNSRIFQDKTVLEIVSTLISEAGFSASYKCDATGSYKSRTYCVQYRESDFSFISRLLEEEGLYYWFEHTNDDHLLHLCDAAGQHPLAPGLEQTPYIAPDGGDRSNRPPHLWRWTERFRPGASKVTLRDYSFLKPDESYEDTSAAEGEGRAEDVELYDFPGGYNAYQVGQMASEKARYASNRLQAARAERNSFSGQGDAFALCAGDRFELTDHPFAQLNGEYLIVSSRHSMSSETYRSEGGGSGPDLEVDIDAIPSEIQYRAPLHTPKPVAGGPQTAKVVGPAGEVIYVDQYGRVKVQFHWDRLGKLDENSSCWIRVSQAWADASFGAMMIPRIGEEVIVDFLEGDPDQPIITGRVYNPNCPAPYALPDNKTRSTWKSRTVGQSGDYSGAEDPPPATNGFNEIRYEDKGASEELFVHAQRDMNSWVRLDQTHKVGRDVAERVGRDRQTNIKRNETLIVETGDETRQVQQGSRQTTIKNADTLTVQDGDSSTTVSSGNYSVEVSSGKATVEAAQEILLKVGGNTIKISPSGVEIQGLTVKVTAETSLSAQGLTSEFKASTMLTINGMPVQIN